MSSSGGQIRPSPIPAPAVATHLCLPLLLPLPSSHHPPPSPLSSSSSSLPHRHACCSLPNSFLYAHDTPPSAAGTYSEHTEEEKEAVEQLIEWQRIRQLSSQDEYETDVASTSPSTCGPVLKKYGFGLTSSLPLHTRAVRAVGPCSSCSESSSVSSKAVVKEKRKAQKKYVSVSRGDTNQRAYEAAEDEEFEFDERPRKKTRSLAEIYGLPHK